MVYPYLQYSNIAWAAQPSKYIDQLFLLQKRAIRIVCKSDWCAHTTPLFNKLQTLKLYDINKLQTGCFMYRYFTNNLPNLFQNYFILNSNIHNYFTRQSQNVHQYAFRTTLRKFVIKHTGPLLWNSLPSYLKNKPSIYSFKFAYKKFLLSDYM
mgnify:FL=1